MTELLRLFYSGRRDSGVTRAHHARAVAAAEHHTMAAVSGPITGSPLRKNYSRAECRCRRRFELQYGHALAVASWKMPPSPPKLEERRRMQHRSGGDAQRPRADHLSLCDRRSSYGSLDIVAKARGLRTGLEAVRAGRVRQTKAILPDIGGAAATMGFGIANPSPAATKEIACSWAGRLDGRLSHTGLFQPHLREHRLGLIGPSRLARGPASRDESRNQDQETEAAHYSLRKAN
jgi:hypothetical protein